MTPADESSIVTGRLWRARVALLASIGGAIALTLVAIGVIYLLAYVVMWPDRVAHLADMGMLALAGSLIVLVSLGFAINRRSFKLSRDGIEASGGDGESE